MVVHEDEGEGGEEEQAGGYGDQTMLVQRVSHIGLHLSTVRTAENGARPFSGKAFTIEKCKNNDETNLKLLIKHRQPHISYRLKSEQISVTKINISVFMEVFCMRYCGAQHTGNNTSACPRQRLPSVGGASET